MSSGFIKTFIANTLTKFFGVFTHQHLLFIAAYYSSMTHQDLDSITALFQERWLLHYYIISKTRNISCTLFAPHHICALYKKRCAPLPPFSMRPMMRIYISHPLPHF